MSAREVLRFQGISTKRTFVENDLKIRAMAGNTMTVPLVSELISGILGCIKGFSEDKEQACSAPQLPPVGFGESQNHSIVPTLTGGSAFSERENDRLNTIIEKVCVPKQGIETFQESSEHGNLK